MPPSARRLAEPVQEIVTSARRLAVPLTGIATSARYFAVVLLGIVPSARPYRPAGAHSAGFPSARTRFLSTARCRARTRRDF